MTTDDEIEFTYEQGLGVGCATLLLFGSLLLLGGREYAVTGAIAFGAIASTVFIQRRLLRRPWFIVFVAVMVIAHTGLVLAFPGFDRDLQRGGVKLIALADIVGVLVLAYGLQKLMLRSK